MGRFARHLRIGSFVMVAVWASSCSPGGVASQGAQTATGERALATCDGQWHFVSVTGTQCLDGSSTGFEYKCRTGSASSPLVIYLDGGGACWDGTTCHCGATGLCTDPLATITRNHFQSQD